jgi:hypothetical protein
LEKNIMKYKNAQSSALKSSEVVLNLWAYVDKDGYIYRLAGKYYVMDGDDEEKLALLRALSRTDFLSSEWSQVPANFKIINHDEQIITGIATASMLSDPITHSHIFSQLLEKLANALPWQLRACTDGYKQFKLELPQDPLCVTTVIMEYADGSLVPMISSDQPII